MEATAESRAMEIREFNRYYTNIVGAIDQTILDSPYSLAEARVMLEINQSAECTASDLTRILQIDAGYLSRILRKFNKEGLVQATKAAPDGRTKLLTLTDLGKATFKQLSDTSTRQIIRLLDHIPAGTQQQLLAHMGSIQKILSGEDFSDISLRSYRPGDAGYIAYRHGVVYAKEYSLDCVFEKYVLHSLEAFLDRPEGGNIWMAEYRNSIIGFIGIVKVDDSTAQLRWFLLEPEYRGLGLGRKLVATALDFCKEQKYNHVFLWTFKGLNAARHLYEDFGFTLTEEKENNTWKNQLIEQRLDVVLSNQR